RDRAYRQSGEGDEILASLGNQTRLNPLNCRHEAGTVMEQKARQHHRRDEFEGPQARAAGKDEHWTRQWLEVRSDLLERYSQVCRSMVPEFVNLGADDRPR